MFKNLLSALWLFLLITGPTYGQNASKKEFKALQGTWKIEKLDIPDDGPRKDFEKHGKVIIKGKTATLMRADQKFAEFTIQLDFRKSPKTADLTIDLIASEKGAKDPALGKKILLIYVLKGDMLRFFAGAKGQKRPTEFPRKAHQGEVTLKRLKGK